jgi:hypothetical protein
MIKKNNDVAESSSYPVLLESVKEKIKTAQLKAALAVNSELVALYWEIGHMLSAKMEQEGWGAKVIDRLAQDLGKDFPGVSGFSPRNLRYMRKFAQTYTDSTILQAVLAKLPSTDNPSIGMIICRTKNDLKVEYALKRVLMPMSVSEYEVKIQDSLPKELQGTLPTAKQIEEKLLEHCTEDTVDK